MRETPPYGIAQGNDMIFSVIHLQASFPRRALKSDQTFSLPCAGDPGNNMKRARIIIVNDGHERGPELQERLLSAGYEVFNLFLAGEQALDRVEELHPDLVLMDIGIRGKVDGVQAADTIQTQLDIPVIYTMSRQDHGQATLQRSKATGPFGYIFEPLDTHQAVSTIEVALSRNRLEREIKESRQWLSTVLNSIGDGVAAVDEQGLITFINPVAEILTGWRAEEAMGQPLSQVFSISESKAREIIGAALNNVPGVTRELQPNIQARLTARAGGEIPVEITISRMRGGKGANKGAVLVFREITERLSAMQEIRRQARRAEALVAVASQLNKQIELGSLLNTVCVTTNKTLKASGTAVFLAASNNEVFRNRAVFSEIPAFRTFEGISFELKRKDLEELLTRQHPVTVIQSLQSNQELPYMDMLSGLGIRMIVLSALFLGEELMGTLISIFGEGRPAISEDEVSLLTGLADQVSSAIQNAELFEQVRMGRERQRVLAKGLVEVQESERRHVARELHDQLGQSLTGLQFLLEGAKGRCQEPQRSELEEIQQYVSEIMEQTRAMSLRLRPGMLDDLGLLPTLRWHLEAYTRQTGIRVEFQTDEPAGRCPAEIETAAYRIIQEALTNTARYAGVSEVSVKLRVENDILWLDVADAGRGFDAAKEFEKPTTGLGGMHERASLAGGYLTLRSNPGQGTRISAALPLKGQILERRKHDRDSADRG